MSAAGIFAGLAQGIDKQRDEKRQDDIAGRDRQADILTAEYDRISQQPLDPNNPQAAQQRAADLKTIRDQITGLYKPHEGPDLFKRLGKLVKRGQPTGSTGSAGESLGLPTGSQAIPGVAPPMPATGPWTLEQVLARNAPPPPAAPKPTYQQTDQGLMAITSNPDGTTTASPVLYNGEPLKGVKADEGVLKELEDGSLVRIVGNVATPITQEGKPVKGQKKEPPKETPDEKMIAIDAKVARGQPLTDDEKGYQAGYLAHQKEKSGTTESTSATKFDDMGNPISTSRTSKKVYSNADGQKSGATPVQQKDGPNTKTPVPAKAATAEDARREAANGNVIAQEAIDWAEKGTKPTGNTRAQSIVRRYMAAHGMSPQEKPQKESTEQVAAEKTADTLDTAYTAAKERLKKRSPAGDQGIVFAWVKSQVAGAGRMNNLELEGIMKAAPADTRMANVYQRFTKGTLDDDFIQGLVDDIGVSAHAARATADKYKSPTSTENPEDLKKQIRDALKP